MGKSKDWFRNTDWNDEIEAQFEEKLRRAREWNRPQYLRIQATYLTKSHPLVALALIDRYLDEFPSHFDRASAYVTQAEAYLLLGKTEEAVEAYERAITRETAFPNVRTSANLHLPYMVATRQLAAYYDRALEILAGHSRGFDLPIQMFCYHASFALIMGDQGDTKLAAIHAEKAIVAANLQHSGFRYHPTLGLVSGNETIVSKLKEIRWPNSNR